MTATTPPAVKLSGTDDYGVRFLGNPLRLAFSASPWRSAGFLFSYLIMSGVLFSVALTAAVTAAALAFTLIAFPLLIAAANVVHGCAAAERTRLRWVLAQPVRASYQQAAGANLRARASASWRNRGTWRELAYLTGLWVPLMALDTIVVSIWATLLAGVTLPFWYWAPWEEFGNGQRAHGVQLGYFPSGPNGAGGHGLYINTLPRALLAAAGFAIVFLLFNYVLVATARMHGRVARALLRAPADALAEVRTVLAGPGPLGPMTGTGSLEPAGPVSG
jgi:Putative sensor